jgi:1-acyl-sn-glycerol-3-phosphate acyltransferase
MRSIAACWKLMRAAWRILVGWWTIRFVFPKLSPGERNLCVQQWSLRTLQALGIRMVVQGELHARGPVLLVCNHLSWLDIVVIHAAGYVRFVSKAGVHHWPLIGTLATGAGTLYIERESRRDALRVVHKMTEALRNGDRVAVFPEGTTSDGTAVLPFHANLLQAAIAAGVPVQPATLCYTDAGTGRTSQAARYIDDDDLLTSLWRTLKAPPLLAIVRFGTVQPSQGRERRAWAASLHADVVALRDDNAILSQ